MLGTELFNEEVQQQIDKLRAKAPVPLFWLFGKTQSGKTSIVRFLTGAENTEIGLGFKPCTRFSREYVFPTADAPLLRFLDTRGLDEPGYDPAEEIASFNDQAHVVIVTVKALDHAQENVIKHLHTIRTAKPQRPVILALTCLHEAYPQQQHPDPYPFAPWIHNPSPLAGGPEAGVNKDLLTSLDAQRKQFDGLVDVVVPIDLTRPEEGYVPSEYGGDVFKRALLDMLPDAYRQTLLHLDEALAELQDVYARGAMSRIVAYSTLAGSVGAVPIPWIDLLILPSIQTRMIFDLARFYGQPLSAQRFLELASTLGIGIVLRQAVRELAKFVPYVGSIAGSGLAAASTYALGKAFCFYYRAVHQGHVPKSDELKGYYQEQLKQAERTLFGRK